MEFDILFKIMGFAVAFLTTSVATACACVAIIIGSATMIIGAFGLSEDN